MGSVCYLLNEGQVLSAETVACFPIITVFVEPAERNRVPGTGLRRVGPHCCFDRSEADFVDRFVVHDNSL